MNLAKVKNDWKSRGFSCDIWTDPPGQCWEDFTHQVDELFMVIEGRVELVVGGKTSHPKPGEEILIPENVVHSVRNIGSSPSRWFYGYKN